MIAEEVRQEIIRHVSGSGKGRAHPAPIRDETNLIEESILDSIGFVGLIAALEAKFDVELDLVEKPIEEFIVVGSLVRQVLEAASARASGQRGGSPADGETETPPSRSPGL